MKCSMCGSLAGCTGCPIAADYYMGERLADLAPGDRAVVLRLDAARGSELRKLLSLGLLPGVEIEVERRWPAVVLRVGPSILALDEELAGAVLVERAA